MWSLGDIFRRNNERHDRVLRGEPEVVRPEANQVELLQPDEPARDELDLAGTITPDEYGTSLNTDHAEYDIPATAPILNCAFAIKVPRPQAVQSPWFDWTVNSLSEYGYLKTAALVEADYKTGEGSSLGKQLFLVFIIDLNSELLPIFRLHLADLAIVFGVKEVAFAIEGQGKTELINRMYGVAEGLR
jgi:hypothetical protein